MRSSLDTDIGHILYVRDKDGIVVSGQFFLEDGKTFHAVAHGSSPTGIDLGGSAMCYRALVELALAQGINYIDLNGANSQTEPTTSIVGLLNHVCFSMSQEKP